VAGISRGNELKNLEMHLHPIEEVAALMLYARYGRAGVELLQAVFRDRGLSQDAESLRIVKQTTATFVAIDLSGVSA